MTFYRDQKFMISHTTYNTSKQAVSGSVKRQQSEKMKKTKKEKN